MESFGLYKDGEKFYLAHIKKRKRGKFSIISLKKTTNVKQLYIEEKKTLVTGLSASSHLIQTKELKLPRSNKVDKALLLHAESLNFLNADEAITIPIIHHQKDRANSTVSFFSTTHKSLKKHLEQHKIHSVDPGVVSTTSIALARYAKSQKYNLRSLFVIHFGLGETTFTHIENQMPVEARSISLDISSLLSEKSSSKSAPSCLSEKARELRDTLQHEIQISLHSFLTTSKEKVGLLFTGQIGGLKHHISYLLEGWQERVEILQETSAEKENPDFKEYAISIGLALDALAEDRHSLQFRRNGFTSLKALTKSARQLLTILCLSFSVTFAGLFLMEKSWDSRLQKLRAEASRLMQLDSQRSFREISFKGDDLEDLLANWDHNLRKEAISSPFEKSPTRVTDLLSWISSLPDQLEDHSLCLKRLNYRLEKYPKVGAVNAPYLVRVELDFDVISPITARKLHEIISKGNGPINSKKEITWEMSQDRCHATFYLKNRYYYDEKNWTAL